MTFQLPNQPTERNRSPIWVRPNVVHRLACEGACLALFLLPESSEMLKLRRHTKGTHQWLSPKQGQVLLDLAKQNAEHIAQPDVLSGLLLASQELLQPSLGDNVLLDHRVIHIQESLQQTLPEESPSLEALARQINLSRFRLSHLFREQTGITLRRYMLWLRMLQAFRKLTQARTVADAAHAAGFSDHAHFTRTSQKMGGRTPSSLFHDSKIVQANKF